MNKVFFYKPDAMEMPRGHMRKIWDDKKTIKLKKGDVSKLIGWSGISNTLYIYGYCDDIDLLNFAKRYNYSILSISIIM